MYDNWRFFNMRTEDDLYLKFGDGDGQNLFRGKK